MSKAVTDSGSIEKYDPYYFSGVGLPDYLRRLDDLRGDELLERLPAIIDSFDDRLRALEDKPSAR